MKLKVIAASIIILVTNNTVMPLSFQVTGAAKNNLVVSLAAILLSDSNLDISQENIDSVVTASGNTIPSYYSALYANYIEKAGGVERFFAGPSAGGGTCLMYRECDFY